MRTDGTVCSLGPLIFLTQKDRAMARRGHAIATRGSRREVARLGAASGYIVLFSLLLCREVDCLAPVPSHHGRLRAGDVRLLSEHSEAAER